MPIVSPSVQFAPYFLMDQLNFAELENRMFSFSLSEIVVDEGRRVIYTLSGDEGLPLIL